MGVQREMRLGAGQRLLVGFGLSIARVQRFRAVREGIHGSAAALGRGEAERQLGLVDDPLDAGSAPARLIPVSASRDPKKGVHSAPL